MATLEQSLTQLELILREDFPGMLTTIKQEKNDGIALPVPVEYHWEEVSDKLGGTPAVLLIPDVESDPTQKDQLWDAIIRMYVIATNREKSHLTKQLLRYSDATKRILRRPIRRTLNETVTSAKVITVQYGPTFFDRESLYARDVQMEIALRIPRDGLPF